MHITPFASSGGQLGKGQHTKKAVVVTAMVPKDRKLWS